jgi:hypothetical protein
VKYAQCVKIWSFDVLVLFLKCVQFLRDTILNLAIVHFLGKKKGDAPMKRVSPFYPTPQKIEYSSRGGSCSCRMHSH